MTNKQREYLLARVKKLYPNQSVLHKMVQDGDERAYFLLTLRTKEQLMEAVLEAEGEKAKDEVIKNELNKIAFKAEWLKLFT